MGNWKARALCAWDDDPLKWHAESFPNPTPTKPLLRYQMAKDLCRGCPVVAQCAQFALDIKATDMVYGGVLLLMRGKNHETYEELRAVAQGRKR